LLASRAVIFTSRIWIDSSQGMGSHLNAASQQE